MDIFRKELKYRIRIFDQGMHLMTATAPDKGQRFITAVVHSKFFGLGEKTKLAFMINQKIKPKVFGRILEIDFDVRDSVQLGDLLDVCPDLVYELNENYRAIEQLRKRGEILDASFDLIKTDSTSPETPATPAPAGNITNVIPADITVQPLPDKPVSADSDITFLTDKPSGASPQKVEKAEEDERPIDTILKNIKEAGHVVKALVDLKRATEDTKKERIETVLSLCKKYPKILYWLPDYIDIEPEIHAIVMQSLISHVGVAPSYYFAQSGAMIAEKVLTRPKEKQGWEQVVLILGVLGIVAVMIIAVVYFLIHPGTVVK